MIAQRIQARLLVPLQKATASLAAALQASGNAEAGSLVKSFYEHIAQTPAGLELKIFSGGSVALPVDRGPGKAPAVPVDTLLRFAQMRGISQQSHMGEKSAATAASAATNMKEAGTQPKATAAGAALSPQFLEKLRKELKQEIAQIVKEEFAAGMSGILG